MFQVLPPNVHNCNEDILSESEVEDYGNDDESINEDNNSLTATTISTKDFQ